MEKVKCCLKEFVPGLPHSDLVQLSIFLGLFTLTSFALVGNWLGVSYLLNNGAILLVCFFTIALPPNTRIYYLFSTSLPISAIIDLFTISLNWNHYFKQFPGHLFFLSFFLALILVVAKFIISLHQFEIAKSLNSEQSPVSIVKIYRATLNAITLQQTVKPKNDIEAAMPTSFAAASQQPAQSVEPEAQVTVIQVPKIVEPVQQPMPAPVPQQPQNPPANFKSFNRQQVTH